MTDGEIIENLVIGAGPAGLTTAYCLAKAGAAVRVLEQDPTYVGGISRTVHYKGFLFDIGGHRFFSKVARRSWICGTRSCPTISSTGRASRASIMAASSTPIRCGPSRRWAISASIESAACMMSYGWATLSPVKSPRTFHQWVRNQFGERLFSIFFKTYTEKVWGMSCDEISADWAAQRIKGLDLAAAVIDGVKRSLGVRAKGGATAKTLIESFRYPRRGPGMMWEACATKIAAMGGQVVMDTRVTGLAWDAEAGLWSVAAVRGDGTRETLTARNVISSAPMRELVSAITPPPRTQNQAGELKYRDFLTVVLIGKSSLDLPDNWVYIHDPSVKVGRVQNFRSWSPEMIPDPVSTCLGLEYFCFEGDGLWSSSDDDLIALAKREIGVIGLMRPEDVTDACVVRQAKAYPVYDETYRDNVAAVRDELASLYPTLHLVGRNGMHKYNNQDHAMMTGMLTALNIQAGKTLYDVWDVNEDAEYGEAGVSGAREALASERLVPSRAA